MLSSFFVPHKNNRASSSFHLLRGRPRNSIKHSLRCSLINPSCSFPTSRSSPLLLSIYRFAIMKTETTSTNATSAPATHPVLFPSTIVHSPLPATPPARYQMPTPVLPGNPIVHFWPTDRNHPANLRFYDDLKKLESKASKLDVFFPKQQNNQQDGVKDTRNRTAHGGNRC